MSNASEARELRKEQRKLERKGKLVKVAVIVALVLFGTGMLWLGWRIVDTSGILAPNQSRLYNFYGDTEVESSVSVTMSRKSVSAYWPNMSGNAVVIVGGKYFVVRSCHYDDFNNWMLGGWWVGNIKRTKKAKAMVY